ncbi:MAG: iron-containing redox enzyme family protein [Deltaproteobacteria bacterium]|nr:iron-containing redox enzyme family protein [Deltaproteobacteria bacterium]
MREKINSVKARFPVTTNPYFVALAQGTMSREDFLETQIQFLFAVVFFARPLAVLAGRLPRPELRLGLLLNIADEHGNGDLRLCHERTFLELLARFGVSRSQIEERALWPEVRAFNTTLSGLCMLDDGPTALAALGMIEDLFAEVSATIGRAIVSRGWLPADQVIHYAVHEKLDVEHSESFYRMIEPMYATDRGAYQIDQGLELGAYVFMRMYEDLGRSCARRWTRTALGPHSLADGWTLEAPTPRGQSKAR